MQFLHKISLELQMIDSMHQAHSMRINECNEYVDIHDFSVIDRINKIDLHVLYQYSFNVRPHPHISI